MSYTKGPWLIADDDTSPNSSSFVYALNEIGYNRFWLNVCAGDIKQGERTSDKEIEDNARLIASAPDLLEALEAAIEWIDAVPPDTMLPAMPGFERDWVETIIAKAKGKA